MAPFKITVNDVTVTHWKDGHPTQIDISSRLNERVEDKCRIRGGKPAIRSLIFMLEEVLEDADG